MSGPATQDIPLVYRRGQGEPIATNDYANMPVDGEYGPIFIGSLVGIDGGFIIPAFASVRFIGIAGSHAEDGEFPIIYNGIVAKVSLPNVTTGDIGKIAYAMDSGTATLSPPDFGHGISAMGPIVDVETDIAWIDLTLKKKPF